MPTPDDRWWTTLRGWDDVPAGRKERKKARPSRVMPTGSQEPALYPTAEETIGTLRVEVLEAEKLPGDTMSAADPYALLIFEGCAAVTNIIWNHASPGWSAKSSYRAFEFPIRHPHSTLCLALMESDTHEEAGLVRHMDVDDVIGRLTVRLGTKYANTQYDSWYPLGLQRDPKSQASRHGSVFVGSPSRYTPSVRIRYSFGFHTDRQRLLGYLEPPLRGTPVHEIAFDSELSNELSKGLFDGAKFGERY